MVGPRTPESEAIDWCNSFTRNRLLNPARNNQMLTPDDRGVVDRLREQVAAGDEQVISYLALLNNMLRSAHSAGITPGGQSLDYEILDAFGLRQQITALRIGRALGPAETVQPVDDYPILLPFD